MTTWKRCSSAPALRCNRPAFAGIAITAAVIATGGMLLGGSAFGFGGGTLAVSTPSVGTISTSVTAAAAIAKSPGFQQEVQELETMVPAVENSIASLGSTLPGLGPRLQTTVSALAPQSNAGARIFQEAAKLADKSGGYMNDLKALEKVVTSVNPSNQIVKMAEYNGQPVFGYVRGLTGIVEIQGVTQIVRLGYGAHALEVVEILGPFHP